MRIGVYFYCLLLLILLGCASRKIYTSSVPVNPTAYDFPVRIDSVAQLFTRYYFKHHGSLGFDLENIHFRGDGYSKSFWNEMTKEHPSLSGAENKHNIRMVLRADSSTVYRGKNGRRLEYQMKCIAHCVAPDSSHTRISIEVYSAQVILGTQLLPSPPHFVNNPIYRNVKPTTVEEYKLLLCVGKGLGIYEQMPALKTN